ncbi:nicotinamide riboside transporter PnuC [Aeromicrobium sp. 179-A 4D2 NHS]|uniref:nicotinamide riboside transporter PnuC n=1 Tax=Aeromicrobium sp. 179-A 4D2 NHS TaxID=3142375 RepID=UPI0039A36C8C
MNYTRTIKQDVTIALGAGLAITALSYLVALAAGWVDGINWLEALAVVTSYACVILVVFQRRINYLIGAVGTASYAILFWQWGLVASAMLNIYMTPALIYGWMRWKSDTNTRPVGFVAAKWWPAYIAATVVAYLGALGIVNLFDGKFAPADAIIFVGSMLAQFLLDNKKIESWAVWGIVNVAAIYTYFNTGLYLAGFQYVFFLANACFGAWVWYRAKTTNDTNRGDAVARIKEMV